MKRFFAAFAALIIIICIFASCSAKPGTDDSSESGEESTMIATLPPLPEPSTTSAYDTTGAFISETEQTSAAVTESGSQIPVTVPRESAAAPQTEVPQTAAPTAAPTVPETTEKYKKTGVMHFSDSPDNKYLAAVASKYGVDAKLLAAIYTVPDANGNIVLRFSGEKDAKGKLIRNESTLVCIYSIDKSLNSKCASEDAALNEYSENEMKVMYLSLTKFILPKFEKELSGQ